MANAPHTFDEELLSGYLDGSLSHRDMQKVRLRLETDDASQRIYRELKALRESALATRFMAPEENDWPELPKTTVSRFSRSLGWLLLCSWLIVVSALSLWRFLSQTGDPLEIFIVLGLPGSFVLLFLSVLIDRMRNLKTDPYRDVHR